jgi:hypothetical protein
MARFSVEKIIVSNAKRDLLCRQLAAQMFSMLLVTNRKIFNTH